jgi:hypothetical protein
MVSKSPPLRRQQPVQQVPYVPLNANVQGARQTADSALEDFARIIAYPAVRGEDRAVSFYVIVPRRVLRSTDPPSRTKTSDNIPVAGARISWVTLSVSISTNGSSRLTGSPARLNHRPTDSLTSDFTSVGTRISVTIELIL